MTNIYKSNFTWCLMLFITAVCLGGCADDDADSAFNLYYPDIIDVGVSMDVSTGNPSYLGPKPSSFAIVGVKLDDEPYPDLSSFSIDAESGNLSVTNTMTMPVGTYKISISCKAGNTQYTFMDIVTMEMLPSVPATIEVVPSVLNISYHDSTGDESAQVNITSSSASVTNYYLVQENGKEYFKISDSGLITINENYEGELAPGVYSVTVRVLTQAGQAVFNDVLTVHITSAPLELTYKPDQQSMEAGLAFIGIAPQIKASIDGLTYSIKGVTPSTDKIKIDPSTGILSVAEGNGFLEGETYVVDVTATNDFGSKDFDGAFTLKVVAFIDPISNFSYDPISKAFNTAWGATPAPNFVGGEVFFSIKSVSDPSIGNYISIDNSTGEVSAEKGNKIPEGGYTITVLAENIKSSQEATLALTITENIYYFTTISYGNNLGLSPASDYASQFLTLENDVAPYVDAMPVTDMHPSATGVMWEITFRYLGNSNNIMIDENTGRLTVNYRHTGGGCNLIFVQATAGVGLEEETSVLIPVFFVYPLEVGGVTVYYKPFVFQVDPIKGGRSTAPIVEGLTPDQQFIMTFRRSYRYFNLNGPPTHVNATGTVTADNFLGELWRAYYALAGGNLNYGASNPVYYNVNTAGISLAYVSPTDGAVVVNPNKWVDSSGKPANGLFFGQMPYAFDGLQASAEASSNRIFPIFIWFDENF